MLLLLAMQVLSLASAIFIEKPMYMDNPKTYYNSLVMLALNLLVILPWSKYNRIEALVCRKKRALHSVTKILLVISGFTFIILLVTAVAVTTLVSDVNAFKYAEGESMEFYYTMLPFNVRYFILASQLYNLSYILLPLHFYYQTTGEKKYSFWCGLFSTNIVLYGMTFFSRWTILLFILLYLSLWILCNHMIPEDIRLKMKKTIRVVAILSAILFVSISVSRFTNNKLYEAERIAPDARIQNPVLYSFFDYLGQNNSSGLFLLNKYKGTTFRGTYTVSNIHSLLYGFGLTGESSFNERRSKLWGEYAGGFSGWATYTVYDYGYILAFVVAFTYYYLVRKRRSKMSVDSFISSSFLIQIPLCAIFYSWLSTVVFCFFIYFFIWLFIKLSES